ncbi:hypothetical protein Acr_19g0003440 [Actinidia rufa]|uniref:Uncharacterized protein n=1 Tax=Actinidia rufa TaxID=165716 RepID=A0A7J0G9C2_9ERIC|nr:hypothetical protein Acr_19g0003440 [Actinidia rufa]
MTMHLEELDDPQKFAEGGIKFISQLEYISQLHELKDEITRAWKADDRMTSLKLSINVARGTMALEDCSCIASSFNASAEKTNLVVFWAI